ncbi:MAG: serine/threonine protein phosphatase [Betaproteobacteria bacterium RIFCSPLOWO2_12_FULL_68_20]|nr:MAG: serine/threonine protein phosphatase [Betaproteobacteria bacterium RIFCSPLOWO2_12_FULL_68_20]
MSLQVSTGYCSLAGSREENQDFCGMATPAGAELDAKGVIAAVADGVSGGRGGREAAEYSVRGLLADYYATPDTWAIPHALDRVLNANNRWLISQASTHRQLDGMATTLTALVLRGRRYTVAHVGDSRAYLLRDGRLTRLTTDHVWDRPDMRHVLKRAIGLDPHLAVDYSEDRLRAGDVFALASDGVWEPIGEHSLKELLQRHADPAAAAAALVEEALARGGQDNASAVVLRVDAVPEADRVATLAEGRTLPLPPRLKPGHAIDGFDVLELLHESRATLLYKVRSRGDATLAVLKTLQPSLSADGEQRAALAGEEWLARRVLSHYFPQVLPAPERNYLYYLMSYHEGATLQQRLDAGAHFAVPDAVRIGIRILKGLGALHRLNVVHRDVKPANLHLGADDKLRILDLGVALNPGAIHETSEGAPGTPSYMAPELFEGASASVASDLYATGVTMYHMLTRKYPYGEIEPFQHPRFGDPLPPTRYRPDVPQWLEAALLKALARDPVPRFETAEEMLLALERGERLPLALPRRSPLAARYFPLALWRSLAVALLVLNLLLLYLLVAR